jgi:hypothetical protein
VLINGTYGIGELTKQMEQAINELLTHLLSILENLYIFFVFVEDVCLLDLLSKFIPLIFNVNVALNLKEKLILIVSTDGILELLSQIIIFIIIDVSFIDTFNSFYEKTQNILTFLLELIALFYKTKESLLIPYSFKLTNTLVNNPSSLSLLYSLLTINNKIIPFNDYSNIVILVNKKFSELNGSYIVCIEKNDSILLSDLNYINKSIETSNNMEELSITTSKKNKTNSIEHDLYIKLQNLYILYCRFKSLVGNNSILTLLLYNILVLELKSFEQRRFFSKNSINLTSSEQLFAKIKLKLFNLNDQVDDERKYLLNIVDFKSMFEFFLIEPAFNNINGNTLLVSIAYQKIKVYLINILYSMVFKKNIKLLVYSALNNYKLRLQQFINLRESNKQIISILTNLNAISFLQYKLDSRARYYTQNYEYTYYPHVILRDMIVFNRSNLLASINFYSFFLKIKKIPTNKLSFNYTNFYLNYEEHSFITEIVSLKKLINH